MSTFEWLQIIIYAASFGTMSGVIMTKLKYLEDKMDKHNCLIERMYTAEKNIELSQQRIGELERECVK